jgi:hypothetical protein
MLKKKQAEKHNPHRSYEKGKKKLNLHENRAERTQHNGLGAKQNRKPEENSPVVASSNGEDFSRAGGDSQICSLSRLRQRRKELRSEDSTTKMQNTIFFIVICSTITINL